MCRVIHVWEIRDYRILLFIVSQYKFEDFDTYDLVPDD